MNPKLMIAISVVLSALAQLCLKHGLSTLQKRESRSSVMALVLPVVQQPYVWLWGMCFAIATALWLLGVQRVDLSFAFPLVGLGYIVVSLLSSILFHERLEPAKWLSILLIGVGVVLVAGS